MSVLDEIDYDQDHTMSFAAEDNQVQCSDEQEVQLIPDVDILEMPSGDGGNNKPAAWGDSDYEQSDQNNAEETPAPVLCKMYNSAKGCSSETCELVHQKFTCAFYMSEQGCDFGDKCLYLHQAGNPLSLELKVCPNDGCQRLCSGKQCSFCHHKQRRRLNNQRSERNEHAQSDKYRRERRQARQSQRNFSASPYSREFEIFVRKRIKMCDVKTCGNTTIRRFCEPCFQRRRN